MEYLNESINNVEKVKNKIQKDGIIEIGCVYCIAIYPRTKSMEDLQSINNKLICHICGMDTLIPITNDSVLEKECIAHLSYNKTDVSIINVFLFVFIVSSISPFFLLIFYNHYIL